MKRLTRLEGFPFYKGKTPCVCMYGEDNIITFAYQQDGEYFADTMASENLPLNNDEVFKEFSLYAKIVSVQDSIIAFDGEQRKRDVFGSVLRVYRYSLIDNMHRSVTLMTNRNDGVSIKMLQSDLEFIFPTIQRQGRNKKIPINVGSVVIAIKDSVDGLFKKGEIFDVVKLKPHEMMQALNLLHLSDGNKEVITYSKYFKIFK